MARPAKGSVRWNVERRVWTVRITLPNGSRQVVPMHGIAQEDTDRARRIGELVSKRAREGGAVTADTSETVNEWFDRWADSREGKFATVSDDRGRFLKWIAPTIGVKPMANVVRRELEVLVENLDTAVNDDDIRWKTAVNVWGVVTAMFRDASSAKVLSLRVREDNPSTGIQGPDRGAERDGPYLFPSELATLLACERVPLRWKRLVALSVYSYVRASELAALDWGAIHFDAGYLHVHRSMNAKGVVKPTKSKHTRKVPIEPALWPLLASMHRDADGKGAIASLPPREDMAERLRTYLKWAGVTREELFADDETRRPLTWHDLRHTGITWRAIRGDEPLKIMRAAGHQDFATSQRYINEAETFGVGIGELFGPLPEGLLGSATVSAFRSPTGHAADGGGQNQSGGSLTKSAAVLTVTRVTPTGLETAPGALENARGNARLLRDSAADAGLASPEARADSVPSEPEVAQPDAVESALAAALTAAVNAARFDVVAQLAKELEARRLSRARVPTLDDVRRRRDGTK